MDQTSEYKTFKFQNRKNDYEYHKARTQQTTDVTYKKVNPKAYYLEFLP